MAGKFETRTAAIRELLERGAEVSGRWYILVGGEPMPVGFLEWARWLETADRVVARDAFEAGYISTVFLGLDHSFSSEGPPLIFETMIFGGVYDGYEERCSTLDEAKAMHARAVLKMRGLKP